MITKIDTKMNGRKICRGIDHLHINVSNINVSGKFYDELMKYFGFETLDKADNNWWWHNDGENTFGIEQTGEKYIKNKFHRKQTGLNHIAFRAKSKKDVDEFYNKFLRPHNITVLYGGPKNYPEYHDNYYAIFFEDPDRIKLEFMWLDN